jgi:hypothetical protein
MYAQTAINLGVQNSNAFFKHSKLISKTVKIDYSDIKGSPYLNENFTKSTLIMNNNEKIEIKLRYNIFSDSLQIEQKGKILNLNKNNNIKEVIIDGRYFCFIALDNSLSKTIVEKIYDYKLRIYLKHQVSYKKAQIAKSATDSKHNRFVNQTPKLYLKTPFNGSLIRIRKAKDFAKIFPRSSSEIKKFIKKNKIKIGNKEQLIQLARYIEQIA